MAVCSRRTRPASLSRLRRACKLQCWSSTDVCQCRARAAARTSRRRIHGVLLSGSVAIGEEWQPSADVLGRQNTEQRTPHSEQRAAVCPSDSGTLVMQTKQYSHTTVDACSCWHQRQR